MMFEKLQKRLTLLIMTVISAIMIIVFIIIYSFTYLDIKNENKIKLQEAVETVFPVESSDIFSGDNYETEKNFKKNANSFTITVNSLGQISDIQSSTEMEQDKYIQAVKLALATGEQNSKIELEQKIWIFQMNEKDEISLGEDSSNHGTIWLNKSKVFTFLDITDSHRILTRLGITLGVTAFIMLFIIYAISSFFARRSVTPIKLVYQKQKQFIADASHELKTPIASINANVDVLLANRQDIIENQKKWLTYIKEETDYMNRLVKSLLYLAKTDEIDTNHNSLPFNISDTILDTVLSMEAVVYEKGLELVQHIEPGLIVKGDSDKVAQVVMILLDNAIKYSTAGGSVEIKLSQNKHQVIFSICNTVDEITNEDIPKLFDRFYRADSSRKHNDSYGLGLSIARAIIERMGGKIYASCVERKNITFVFELNKYSYFSDIS